MNSLFDSHHVARGGKTYLLHEDLQRGLRRLADRLVLHLHVVELHARLVAQRTHLRDVAEIDALCALLLAHSLTQVVALESLDGAIGVVGDALHLVTDAATVAAHAHQLHHAHLVRRQRSRLVGADDCRAAQRLHRR